MFNVQKKRQGRVAELETQISQLEDALRTVKDQLIVSESWKKQAKLDAEESRKELLAITLKLEESQKLLALSSSHETHVSSLFFVNYVHAIALFSLLTIIFSYFGNFEVELPISRRGDTCLEREYGSTGFDHGGNEEPT